MTTVTSIVNSGIGTLPSNVPLDPAPRVMIGAGVGALGAYLFRIISPPGGAVFGGVYVLTNLLVTRLAEKFCVDQDALKVMTYATSIIAGWAAGILAATVAGFPLTALGGVGMLLAMVITSVVITILARAIVAVQEGAVNFMRGR